MKLQMVIHGAEEHGLCTEVPSIPGRVTQRESFDGLLTKLYEAIDGCLSVEVRPQDTP